MPARVEKPVMKQKGSAPAATKAAAVTKKKPPLDPYRWRGGVVGGALRVVAGSDLCWRVKFGGYDTQKFATEREAKNWRRKMSNALDRTANLWRVHPDMDNTIEMKLTSGKSVLYDESYHSKLVDFRWHFNKPARVFTRGKLIVGRLGVNRRQKRERPEVQSRPYLSMLTLLNRKGYRHRKGPKHGVIDNRLANLTNTAVEIRARKAEVS